MNPFVYFILALFRLLFVMFRLLFVMFCFLLEAVGYTFSPADAPSLTRPAILYHISTGGRIITVFENGRTDYELPEETFFEKLYYHLELDEWPWNKIIWAICLISFLTIYEKSPKFRHYFTIVTMPIIYCALIGLCWLWNEICVHMIIWLAMAIGGIAPAIHSMAVDILDRMHDYVHQSDAGDYEDGHCSDSVPSTPQSNHQSNRLVGGEIIASSKGHRKGFIGRRELTPFSTEYKRRMNGVSEFDRLILQVAAAERELAEQARRRVKAQAEADRLRWIELATSRTTEMEPIRPKNPRACGFT